MRPEGAGQRRPAARLAVRADPLERNNVFVVACRRSGCAGDRSVLRPAGGEGDAGQHCASRIRGARLRADARSDRAAAGEWWCRVAVKGGHGLLLAGEKELAAWRDTAAKIFSGGAAEYIDEARGLYRAALFVDGRLEGCLSVGPAAAPPVWDPMKALFEADTPAPFRAYRAVGQIGRWNSRSGAAGLRVFRCRRQYDPHRDRRRRRKVPTRSELRCGPAPTAVPACPS